MLLSHGRAVAGKGHNLLAGSHWSVTRLCVFFNRDSSSSVSPFQKFLVLLGTQTHSSNFELTKKSEINVGQVPLFLLILFPYPTASTHRMKLSHLYTRSRTGRNGKTWKHFSDQSQVRIVFKPTLSSTLHTLQLAFHCAHWNSQRKNSIKS